MWRRPKSRRRRGGPACQIDRDAPDAAFPLAVSRNGRHLVDHDNRPFLIVGDSPQALVVNVSVKQESLSDNRKAAGFNAVWVNLLSDGYTGVGRMAARMTESVR